MSRVLFATEQQCHQASETKPLQINVQVGLWAAPLLRICSTERHFVQKDAQCLLHSRLG